MILLTNNPKVLAKFSDECAIQAVAGGHADVFSACRDLVHRGHRLLTHPLAGSIKPNETPYRSIALTERTGPLDLESLQLIEDALTTSRKFQPRPGRGERASDEVKDDFAEIDLRLIEGAIGPHLLKGE